MANSPFPKVPIEIVPDPRWPWNPIFLGEAIPGPTRIESEAEGSHLTAEFTTAGAMRKERLGLRRWWRLHLVRRARG